QHERRLRGRRPDHRALPRPRGCAASCVGARPAERGRPDDDGHVGTARQQRRKRLMAKVDETAGPTESDVQTEQAARRAELAVPAEIAADSVGEYFRTALARVKAG